AEIPPDLRCGELKDLPEALFLALLVGQTGSALGPDVPDDGDFSRRWRGSGQEARGPQSQMPQQTGRFSPRRRRKARATTSCPA
ncbi:hypothetical protein ACSHWI_15980, partial [Methylococcus sp. S2T]|uniref:hypothetical protein n=1 Tax=Methylococcus sp. S2T TaxID=3438967 RepID=UPI003ED95F55